MPRIEFATIETELQMIVKKVTIFLLHYKIYYTIKPLFNISSHHYYFIFDITIEKKS